MPVGNPATLSPSTGNEEVKALANLINLAVQDIINKYSKHGHLIPSLHSTETGPFDALHLVSSTLAKAIQIVEVACTQLSYTVANPGHTITNYEEPACMLVVTNAKIADILDGKPDRLHVEELARGLN